MKVVLCSESSRNLVFTSVLFMALRTRIAEMTWLP